MIPSMGCHSLMNYWTDTRVLKLPMRGERLWVSILKCSKINMLKDVWCRKRVSISLYYRMNHRDDTAQMPPLATKYVDQTGLEIINAWIESLP